MLNRSLASAFLFSLTTATWGCVAGVSVDDGAGGSNTGTGSRIGGGTGGNPTGTGGHPTGSGGGPIGTGGSIAGTGGSTVGTGGRIGGTGGGTNGTGGNATGGRGGAAGTGGATTTGGRTGSGGTTTGAGGNTAATGGRIGTGGSTAGTGGRGGATGTGGATRTGGATGTGGTTTTAGCTSVGSSTTVNSTIVVGSGQTYDGACRRFIANASTLGDGSEAEGQEPVFEIQNGGTLINVVLGSPAADGIHTLGNATLRNITWEDIGEDALTVAGSGTVTLDGGSAVNSADKVFQVNAASTFRISNFRSRTAGKFVRQNGGTTFKMQVFIDRCDISNMSESIARTDSSTSTVSMTNTRYSAIHDALFIGFASANITQSGNTSY